MTNREKKMAVALGVAGGLFLVGKYFAPAVHRSVFAVADENKALRAELDELSSKQDEVEPLRREYEEFLARAGGTDAVQLRNTLQAKLTEMVDQAGLSNPRISPRNPTDFRPVDRSITKSGIKQLKFSVSADGPLPAIVSFLKSFYELPYLAQVAELKLDPPTSRAKDKGGLVRMTALVEAIVPPVHPTAEVNPKRLQQPAKVTKHRGGDHVEIALRDPFSEYVAPPPPPTPPPPVVEVPAVVQRPEPEPEPIPDPSPPPPPSGDPQRETKVVRMTLRYGQEDEKARVDEVLVVNTQDRSTEYVGLGGKLDGGNVLLVHPLGAAARRDDGVTRVYPVGRRLSECLPIGEAGGQYPEIVHAYKRCPASKEPELPATMPSPDAQQQQAGVVPGVVIEEDDLMGPLMPEVELTPMAVPEMAGIPAVPPTVEGAAAPSTAQQGAPSSLDADGAAKARQDRAKRRAERRASAATARQGGGNNVQSPNPAGRGELTPPPEKPKDAPAEGDKPAEEEPKKEPSAGQTGS